VDGGMSEGPEDILQVHVLGVSMCVSVYVCVSICV